MIRTIFAVAAMLAAGAVGAVATAEDGPGTVAIHNYAYGPPLITVPKGAKVTWVNHDDTPHTVVAADKRFRSPPMDSGESYSRVYDEVGSFAYVCGLHPQMRGTVVVTPETSATPGY